MLRFAKQSRVKDLGVGSAVSHKMVRVASLRKRHLGKDLKGAREGRREGILAEGMTSAKVLG